MPMPTPEERPDLYDEGYDGLPEGHVSSVTFTPSPQLEALKRPKSGQDTSAAPPPAPAAAPQPAPPQPFVSRYDYYIYQGAVFRAPQQGLPWPREVLNKGQWSPYQGDDMTDILWYGRKVDEAAAMKYDGGGQEAAPQAP